MPMLTSMLMLAILLIVPAMGSTPGCADCPDWVNFNSWWDRYHSEPAKNDPGPSPRDVREMALQARAPEENLTDMDYPAAELLVVSAGGRGRGGVRQGELPAQVPQGR